MAVTAVSVRPSAGRRVPLVQCIDVEPDERQVPLREQRPWTGFEAALVLCFHR